MVHVRVRVMAAEEAYCQAAFSWAPVPRKAVVA
jgi:hypothetical protein